MARPLVSIITPSYNYGRYIDDCLSSIRSQTYPAIEHIVLDACSTDDTAAVVARHARPELRAFFEKDDGQADALNRGFARARGDILCWLNADDFYLHDRVIEEAIAALGDADIVTAGGRYVDTHGHPGRRIRVHPARVVRELPYYDTMLQPATFWRRSIHRPLRTDLHYAFDWQLFIEMRTAGARFETLTREWAAYRMHGINKSAADPAARRGEIAEILGAQWGRGSVQHRWADAIHRGYRLAEAIRSPMLKRSIWVANAASYVLSRRRVFSC